MVFRIFRDLSECAWKTGRSIIRPDRQERRAERRRTVLRLGEQLWRQRQLSRWVCWASVLWFSITGQHNDSRDRTNCISVWVSGRVEILLEWVAISGSRQRAVLIKYLNRNRLALLGIFRRHCCRRRGAPIWLIPTKRRKPVISKFA